MLPKSKFYRLRNDLEEGEQQTIPINNNKRSKKIQKSNQFFSISF
jgi:hypothetical protein